jgi:photosystem II stability/assembly factor-like uncharacterized protein
MGCTFYTSCPCEENAGDGTPSSGSGGASGSGGTDGSGGNSIAGQAGMFEGEWVAVTSNLAELESECGNMSYVSAKPDEDMLIAGVALHGLWASTDGGTSWFQLGENDAEPIVNRTSSITYDPDDPNTFWESGIYNSFGVYKTTDNGQSFQPLGDITHNDFVSIDFSDPDRMTLLASGHELSGTLWLSSDGGETWEPIGQNIPEDAANSAFPLVIDTNTFLLGCMDDGGGVNGIYRSIDRGESWELVSERGGQAAPLVASDGTIYWGVFGGGMMQSQDLGETWEQIVGDVVASLPPVEMPDGSLAMFAASADGVLITSDAGETLRYVTPGLPFHPTGFTYSAHQQAFFAWHFGCEAQLPEDAIMRYDYAVPAE